MSSKKKSLKLFLMMLCYTHRSVICLVIKETSLSSRCVAYFKNNLKEPYFFKKNNLKEEIVWTETKNHYYS